jgi:serine/threonine-protein phosphatase 2A regulatory subunit A
MGVLNPRFSSEGFSKLLEAEVVITRIVPFVRDLCQDSSQHVRAALANQITGLAPLLGHGPTIENLLQLFLHLLKDEFPDVRLNIISKLEQVNEGGLSVLNTKSRRAL